MYKILDLHNDYLVSKKFERSKQNYISKCERLDVSVGSAVWTTEMTPEIALERIKQGKRFTDSNSNAYLAIEDLHFLSKQSMYEVANMQPLYTGLTWNYNNSLAGGALDNGDLTEFGKHVVRNLETSGIIIDTAHLNEKSFMSLANITTKPMLCTHTASYSINPHARNLKDYQIKMIVDSGGIVGLALVSDFLNGRRSCNILDYVKHIDYLVNKFGIEHFAIGTDFNGTKHLPFGITDYKSFKSLLITNLLGLGYKPADINKLLYKNAAQFFNI